MDERRLGRLAARGDVVAVRRLEQRRSPAGWRRVIESANDEARALGCTQRVTASVVRDVFWSALDRFLYPPERHHRALPTGLRLVRGRSAMIAVLAVIHVRAGMDYVTIGAKAIAGTDAYDWTGAGGDWVGLPYGPTPWVLGRTGRARGALHGPAIFAWATNDAAGDRAILPLSQTARGFVGKDEGRRGSARREWLERIWRGDDGTPC